jgi:hypothetical protein
MHPIGILEDLGLLWIEVNFGGKIECAINKINSCVSKTRKKIPAEIESYKISIFFLHCKSLSELLIRLRRGVRAKLQGVVQVPVMAGSDLWLMCTAGLRWIELGP